MKVAVIGGGFAGLAAAFHLSRFCKVELFEQKGIGAGASGAATGLLHPYPGEKGRLSWKADEAMQEARLLLQAAEEEMGSPVANYSGIIKEGACIGAREEDVEKLQENRYFIRSGITVFAEVYIEGLWRACKKRGVCLILRKVDELSELASYDAIVIAVGAALSHFPELAQLKVNFVKGQALLCQLEAPLQQSVAAKTYTAMTEDPSLCHLGATYERGFVSEEPCQEEAVRLLKPSLTVLGCRAGVRVTNPAHYFPIIEKVGESIVAITALGSRGLLYHGYLGRQVALQVAELAVFPEYGQK